MWMYVNVSFKVIFYYLQYIFVKVFSTFNNFWKFDFCDCVNSICEFHHLKKNMNICANKKKHSTNEVCFGQKVLNKYQGVNWIN